MRSPLIIDLALLPRQGDTFIEWERTLDVPADLGMELTGISEGSPLKVRLTPQSVSEGVYIGGSIAAHVIGERARCVYRSEYDVDEVVDELAFYPGRRLALIKEGDEEAEEFPVIEDGHVDIEPVLRDMIILPLLFTSLYKSDCQGLCSGCGKRQEELPDDHFHPLPTNGDDPLAVLRAKLRGDMEQ